MDLGYDSGLCLFYSYFSKVSVWGRTYIPYIQLRFIFILFIAVLLGGFLLLFIVRQ